jgi:hypothetical protein
LLTALKLLLLIFQLDVNVCQCMGSLCNSYVHLFPKPDMALSDWKSSRSDLSVHLGSWHNKFFCFLSIVVQINTPVTSPIASAQQHSFSSCPAGNALIVSFQPTDTTVISLIHMQVRSVFFSTVVLKVCFPWSLL